MTLNRFYSLALTFLVVALGYLSFLILRPFLSPIAWAIVLSLVFYPLYAFIRPYLKWDSIASLVTLLVIMLVILGPFSYLTVLLVNELSTLSAYLKEERLDLMSGALQNPKLQGLIQWLTSLFGMTEAEMNKTIVSSIATIGQEMVSRITKGVGNVASMALDFVFMAFSIFFVLKDGGGVLKRIRGYMPFSDEQKDRLTTQMKDIIVSTVFGGVVVAIVQGLIGGIAFSLLGIPSPVLWGFAISIASFIPLLGAFSIWGPATVYLFVQGDIFHGIALAVVGIFGISLIDNILKPIIIGERTKMPILAIFFSVLGGIKLFGLIGLIAGPLVLALFVSVVEIFRNIEEEKPSS
ncbi:MAG: AI-2E family transporter [Nitrospirales bacterium]|nr:AI-2E family transporter [Nitrospirales bacterium]